ncbi:MAG: hypothetical protein R3B47_08465 [Bacteroidia bacterium]
MFETQISTTVEADGSVGGYLDLTFGTAFSFFGLAYSSAGGFIINKTTTGVTGVNDTSYTFTTTFLEDYATSDDDLFTGNDGDVYIGASFNQTYSQAVVLDVDQGCAVTSYDKTVLSLDSIETTFLYTETHIKNTLLPQYGRLRANILDAAAADGRDKEFAERP